MGIVVAFFVWKWKDPDVLALSPERFHYGAWLGLLTFAVLGYLLYRTAMSGARRTYPAGTAAAQTARVS